MRQFSDDEQGFIPAELQVKKKNATQNIIRRQQQIKQQQQNQKRVLYRFSDGFMKYNIEYLRKQPEQAYNTPFTLPIEPLTHNAQLERKQKSKISYQTPFKEYCSDEAYTLCYCRQSSQPFFQQKHYIKNQVSLLNIQDKNSPSVKELKSFELQEKNYSDDTLEFDSKFESGNLHCAFRRRGTNQYHLFISNDTNTMGYNQWFYFSLRNLMKGVKYTFRIVNYKKMLDFYRNGQRIAIFSMKQSHNGSSGWRWGGNNINFQESPIRSSIQTRMYTLRFQIQPKHHHDYLLLASTIPYSYSRLLHDIKQLQNEYFKLQNATFKTNSICTTICGNQVPQIVITGTKGQRKQKDKKVIIILARQHPGEVWSSYMVLGVMKGLMKSTPEINYLLENCLFLIYPMINIDGVIYGNFRCDLTGVDLNRRWKQPSKIFHTQIFQIKKKIQQVAKKFRVQTCFDFHGHSKKYNIFCYSCKQNSYTCRILPYLISSHNHLFHIPSCTFGISKDKQSTARATISKILRSQSVLTIQTSNFGEKMQLHAKQFQPADINRMGDAILVALRYFSDKKSPAFQESEKQIRENYEQYINYDKNNQEESGSDSQPELDEIDFKVKLNTIFDKKYNNQSKSFAKETCNQAHIHKSDVIYKDQKQLNYSDMDKNKGQNQVSKHDSYPFAIRKNTAKNEQRRNHSKTRTFKVSQLQQDQSQSIQANFSQKMAKQIQIKSHQTIDKNSTTKQTLKSVIIRDKKRFSVLHDPVNQKRQTSTINIAQTDTYRSKQFKQIKNEEQNRRSIEQFVMKYQRFIPASLVHRGKGRLDVLQEGLNHDDGQFQLNIMLQNKRRIELEKLKLRIEESTDIAERQGKIKWNSTKKDPIVDYRRFKKNQKMRLQVKKLGQLSERYLQGHH